MASPKLLSHERAGAECIAMAAEAARGAARAMDLVGWLDERTVLMVLPDTTGEQARAAASRWRSEMWMHSRACGGQKWEIRLADEWAGDGSGADQLSHLSENRGQLPLAS